MLNIDFIHGLERVVGSAGILSDPDELLTYESDALARLRATPGCVVLPSTAEEVQQIEHEASCFGFCPLCENTMAFETRERTEGVHRR